MNEPQYRLLNVGEMIEDGDEYFYDGRAHDHYWIKHKITKGTVQTDSWITRRKITGTDWTPIAERPPGEGDFPCVTGRWSDNGNIWIISARDTPRAFVTGNFGWTHWRPLNPPPKPAPELSEAEKAWNTWAINGKHNASEKLHFIVGFNAAKYGKL